MSYNNGDNEIERMRQRRLASRIAAENGTVMDLSSLAARDEKQTRAWLDLEKDEILTAGPKDMETFYSKLENEQRLREQHNQPQKANSNGKKYQQPNQPVIANLGDPPDGQEWPTHVVIGGEIFMLVPPAVFEESANTAFNRGFEVALSMYRDQIKTPKISEQLSYVEMVRRGDFDAGVDVSIEGVNENE